MLIRRPVAALLLTVALAGGGALTGCSAEQGITGTPKDDAQNTSGADPTSVEQGGIPLEQGNYTAANERDAAEN